MTAGEEPEPLGTGGASSARRPRRWVPWVAAGATALLLLGGVSWRAAVLDSDGDGLTDRVESNGWQGLAGEVYRTSPDRADTDGDGLDDGSEDANGDGIDDGDQDDANEDDDCDGLEDGEDDDDDGDGVDDDLEDDLEDDEEDDEDEDEDD